MDNTSIAKAEEVAGQVSQVFGIEFRKISPEEVIGVLDTSKTPLNVLGLVYGGLMFNLADLCGGIVNIAAGAGGPTVSSEIRYMRSTAGAKELVCHAYVKRMGKTIIFTTAEIYDDRGVLVTECNLVYANKKL